MWVKKPPYTLKIDSFVGTTCIEKKESIVQNLKTRIASELIYTYKAPLSNFTLLLSYDLKTERYKCIQPFTLMSGFNGDMNKN